jgi:hypothetical protein
MIRCLAWSSRVRNEEEETLAADAAAATTLLKALNLVALGAMWTGEYRLHYS